MGLLLARVPHLSRRSCGARLLHLGLVHDAKEWRKKRRGQADAERGKPLSTSSKELPASLFKVCSYFRTVGLAVGRLGRLRGEEENTGEEERRKKKSRQEQKSRPTASRAER